MVEHRLIHELIGVVKEDGNLDAELANALKKLFIAFRNKEIVITVAKKRKSKTKKQLGYYWGCIIPYFQVKFFFAQGRFYRGSDMNLMLKLALNTEAVVDPRTGEPLLDSEGRVMRFPFSSNDEDTIEREEFHQDCRDLYFKWFSEDIPLPDKDWRINQLAFDRKMYYEIKKLSQEEDD